MGTTETTGGTGGTGAARIRPAQEAVAPPSPAASPSPERRVAQPTASPEARTAWPSVPLTSPAVNRPPGDTSARINVRDAVVPDPSPSSPPNEASPANPPVQPGPPRAATPALVREPSLTDLSHSSDGPSSALRSGGTRILVASPDADHTVSSPAKEDTSVSAASPGEQALPHPSPTRVRVASPEPDAPAATDAPVTRRRVSEEPLPAATDTPDNGNHAQDVPVTGAVSPPPVAVFTATDKTPGEATPPAGEPATVKPATIPPDVPADAVITTANGPDHIGEGIVISDRLADEEKTPQGTPIVYGPITKEALEDPLLISDLTDIVQVGIMRVISTNPYITTDYIEELTQEVLTHAIAQYESWAHLEEVNGFLYRLAKNKTIDVIRARENPRRNPAGGFVSEAAFLYTAAEGEFTETIAFNESMRKALLSLRDENRNVLLLTIWEDLSVADIAERLKIAPGTVKSRAYHARETVKILLLHEDEGLTYQEIAELVGLTPQKVEKRIKDADQTYAVNMRRWANIRASTSNSDGEEVKDHRDLPNAYQGERKNLQAPDAIAQKPKRDGRPTIDPVKLAAIDAQLLRIKKALEKDEPDTFSSEGARSITDMSTGKVPSPEPVAQKPKRGRRPTIDPVKLAAAEARLLRIKEALERNEPDTFSSARQIALATGLTESAVRRLARSMRLRDRTPQHPTSPERAKVLKKLAELIEARKTDETITINGKAIAIELGVSPAFVNKLINKLKIPRLET